MTKWSSILFLLIFTANAMSIAVMGIWYMNNQDYFTDNFCINKEKVEMKCNGRCHLQKQFSETPEKKSKEQVSVPVLELEFMSLSHATILPRVSSANIQHHFRGINLHYYPPFLFTEERPPTS